MAAAYPKIKQKEYSAQTLKHQKLKDQQANASLKLNGFLTPLSSSTQPVQLTHAPFPATTVSASSASIATQKDYALMEMNNPYFSPSNFAASLVLGFWINPDQKQKHFYQGAHKTPLQEDLQQDPVVSATTQHTAGALARNP